MIANRILVVDDEEHIRNTVADLLEDQGYRIAMAGDGEEAIQCIRETQRDDPFAMVLTDIQMPKISGEDLLIALRRIDPGLPIIAITGFGDKDLLIRLLRSGVDDYLDKPFDPETLVARVDAVLRGRDDRIGNHTRALSRLGLRPDRWETGTDAPVAAAVVTPPATAPAPSAPTPVAAPIAMPVATAIASPITGSAGGAVAAPGNAPVAASGIGAIAGQRAPVGSRGPSSINSRVVDRERSIDVGQPIVVWANPLDHGLKLELRQAPLDAVREMTRKSADPDSTGRESPAGGDLGQRIFLGSAATKRGADLLLVNRVADGLAVDLSGLCRSVLSAYRDGEVEGTSMLRFLNRKLVEADRAAPISASGVATEAPERDRPLATGALLRLDLERMRATLTSAAHPPLALVNRRTANARVLSPAGDALGCSDDPLFEVRGFPLAPRERLILHAEIRCCARCVDMATGRRRVGYGPRLERRILEGVHLPLTRMVDQLWEEGLCPEGRVQEQGLLAVVEIPGVTQWLPLAGTRGPAAQELIG